MPQSSKKSAPPSGARPRNVRIPGFVTEEPVGLGDVIKRATSSLGIRPCGGCRGRAAKLNAKVTFGGRR